MHKKSALSILYIIVLLILSSTTPVLAHHRGLVLGEATNPAQLDLPTVTQGAGLFLPDSPFYFLDQAYQDFKLKLTANPEKRAKLGLQIAGERLAELKIMLSRNNPAGIDVALSQLKKAEDITAKNLHETAAQGKNVNNLSQEINDAIKSHQQALEKLENQASGSLKLKFRAGREGLKESKNEVEDRLPPGILEKEIRSGLEKEVLEKENDASVSAKRSQELRKELLKREPQKPTKKD